MTTKHPAGPPMTLGNMRKLGVQRLVAYCRRDACRHAGLIDVSKCGRYPAAMVSEARLLHEMRRAQALHRRPAELERAAAKRRADGQGVAMSRTILGDAMFAIVFAIVMVTLARFLWGLM
jgi:hypothetical protein